jgi:D-tyrosyl-tRNA(Tyr) deacylase
MRIVLQRVSQASVEIDNERVGDIGPGLLVLVGIAEGDDVATARRLAQKVADLRLFEDANGRFESSLLETGGDALVVSQFTLYGDVRKGRRPSWGDAARPEHAEPLVEAFAQALEALGVRTARGRFGAHMRVELLNDGPVTLIVDSAELDRPRRSKASD